MTKLAISDVWSGEKEHEAYVAADDDVKDDVDDVKGDVDEVKDDLEDLFPERYEVECQADVPDFSVLDPGDGRLFPNILDLYRVTVKWLVDPHQDHREKAPLYISGYDPSVPEKPDYGNLTTAAIKVGQQFDLVSLLLKYSCRLLRVGAADDRTVGPKTLKHKYVVVVCVFAPTRWVDQNCRCLNQLRAVSEQLSEAENFEMVIVPKMRKCCATSKAAFDKFVSAFSGCLFVPFEDDKVRDTICQSLNYGGDLKAILLDTNHKVVQDTIRDIVSNYYYPSSNENITKFKTLSPDWIRTPLSLYERMNRHRFSSLAQLLDSSYGDPNQKLHRLSSSDEKTITVEQLSDKLVGVYLFEIGDKLDSLINVYDQCKDQKLDFEIVVVCMSMFTTVDPLVFFEAAIGQLEKVVSDRLWWVLPYNAATYAALFDFTMWCPIDAMITVGPRKRFFVDVHGGEVVLRYGIQAYPFHKEMIVRRYVEGAKATTLGSLLSHGVVDYVLRGNDKRVPIAQLHDKVVVVYTYWELDYESRKYKNLCKWYHEIRQQHSDFEVVFVPYKEHEDSDNEKQQFTLDMDVLTRPYDPEHCKKLREKESILKGNDGFGFPMEGVGPNSALLFGKGGQLCSLKAVYHFEQFGLDGYPYTGGCRDDLLREQILYSLCVEFQNFMSMYCEEEPYDVISLE